VQLILIACHLLRFPAAFLFNRPSSNQQIPKVPVLVPPATVQQTCIILFPRLRKRQIKRSKKTSDTMEMLYESKLFFKLNFLLQFSSKMCLYSTDAADASFVAGDFSSPEGSGDGSAFFGDQVCLLFLFVKNLSIFLQFYFWMARRLPRMDKAKLPSLLPQLSCIASDLCLLQLLHTKAIYTCTSTALPMVHVE